MAVTPAYAVAHVFLPNLIKLKTAGVLVSTLERKDKSHIDSVWTQAQVVHDPFLKTVARDPYRIAVIGLPPPKDMGEAYLVAMVVKQSDPGFWRYYLLEHDFVLAKKANRTLLCERDIRDHKKHGEGPPITGNMETDAAAFVDAFMELLVPTKLPKR